MLYLDNADVFNCQCDRPETAVNCFAKFTYESLEDSIASTNTLIDQSIS